MSVKLSSPKVELSVLRAALHKDSRVRNGILGKLDSSYFESDESRELFSYIESSLAKTGEVPPFRVLVDDQSLSREARSFMRDSVPNIQSAEDAKKAVAVLSGYRQTRGLYDVVASVSRKLQGSKVNPTSLLREVGDEIGRLQLTKANAASFTHLGVGNNAKAAVHSLIYDESNDVCIPTGIEVFDKESRGFMRGALVTAGATSGGGKCGTLETEVQLATLVVELDDGTVLEAEPEDLLCITVNGRTSLMPASQICEGCEIQTDAKELSELLCGFQPDSV